MDEAVQPNLPTATTTDADAETVYNYHRMRMPLLRPADAIFALCSLDVRVAERAAQLWLDGYTSHTSTSSTSPPTPITSSGDGGGRGPLIFSGGTGVLTANHARFSGGLPEAEVFARVAISLGVPESHIIVEDASTNTGENVRFTHSLLTQLVQEGRLKRMPASFVLVQKPYMERRTYATFVKQWPSNATGDATGEGGVTFCVTSPELDWKEYPDDENPRELVTNIMVGDLVRIKKYPQKGYQIEQEIPDRVWQAGQRLIGAGYTQHLP
ncbi:DUF218 domain-containing protein [Diplogelasinospora grovesii]|uniref:DUF218 domain-containing protein n=1 Tax=Diplogelasinospora grovesii TaxID=303347 RepID=A0AAN6N6U8_9PEZI|nr:DUF218 domain-containing protein [Diplogelasinospora grovesii]